MARGSEDSAKAAAIHSEKAQDDAARAAEHGQTALSHAWDATKEVAVAAGHKIQEGAIATKDVAAAAGHKIQEGAAAAKDAIFGEPRPPSNEHPILPAKEMAYDAQLQPTAVPRAHASQDEASRQTRELRREVEHAADRPETHENIATEAWHAVKNTASATAEYIAEGAHAVKEAVSGRADETEAVVDDAKHEAKQVGREAKDVAHDAKKAGEHKIHDKAHEHGLYGESETVGEKAEGAWDAVKEKARHAKDAVLGTTESERATERAKDVAIDAKDRAAYVAHEAKYVADGRCDGS
jgi:hypothetical protein